MPGHAISELFDPTVWTVVPGFADLEIGRASCRERVSPYV